MAKVGLVVVEYRSNDLVLTWFSLGTNVAVKNENEFVSTGLS